MLNALKKMLTFFANLTKFVTIMNVFVKIVNVNHSFARDNSVKHQFVLAVGKMINVKIGKSAEMMECVTVEMNYVTKKLKENKFAILRLMLEDNVLFNVDKITRRIVKHMKVVMKSEIANVMILKLWKNMEWSAKVLKSALF